jgi:hypothetical protein
MTAVSVDVVPFLKASLWRCSVFPQSPGENPRSPYQVVAVLLRRVLLEDAILEFSRREALCCLGGGGPPRSALFGQASFVLCTRGVSQSVLPWCSLMVCELCWSIPGGGSL